MFVRVLARMSVCVCVCMCVCVCVCVCVCTKGQNGYKYVCFDLNQHKIQLLSFHNFASDGIFEMLLCKPKAVSFSVFLKGNELCSALHSMVTKVGAEQSIANLSSL